MSAVCSICRREDRPAIEQSHIDGLSLRAIAAQHPGTTAWSLRRHFLHVPAIIERQLGVQNRQAQNDRTTAKLPTRIEQLIAELERMAMNALRRKDHNLAVRIASVRLQCLKVAGELTGELRSGPGEIVPAVQVNVGETAPKMTAEQFEARLRAIYNLGPRKTTPDKIM